MSSVNFSPYRKQLLMDITRADANQMLLAWIETDLINRAKEIFWIFNAEFTWVQYSYEAFQKKIRRICQYFHILILWNFWEVMIFHELQKRNLKWGRNFGVGINCYLEETNYAKLLIFVVLFASICFCFNMYSSNKIYIPY